MFDITTLDREPPEELLAAADLVNELQSLFAERDRLEARISRLVSLVQSTESHERDGYSSVTALLKHRMLLHPGEAERFVARGRGLPFAPRVSAAFSVGALSGAQVDILLQGQAMAPTGFAEEEERLIEMANGMPVRELRRLVDYWLDREVPNQVAADRELAREWRSLFLRRDGDMMRLSGWVDIEAGELLLAALEPRPPVGEDKRSAPARRADALIDMVNGASDRPNLLVHVSYETLTGSGAGTSETAQGTFLTVDEIRRLACDANLTRVVFGPLSQPLDVGRTKRLVTPALRAALSARDRGCVFPGCDRPSQWCDAHHLQPWADGGPTSVENLVLLCRHHHTLVHEGGWRIDGIPSGLRFYRPDGTRLGRARRRPARPRPSEAASGRFMEWNPPQERIPELLKQVPRLRGP